MATIRTSTLTKGRLAQLTRAYPVLQGYATLPFLSVLLIPALTNSGIVRGVWSWLLAAGCILAADFGSRRVRRWYEGRFGLVRPAGGRNWRPFLTFVGLLLIGMVLVPGLLQRFAGVPSEVFDGQVFSWPYVVYGVLLLGVGFAYRPYLPFSAVFGALLAALSLVPLGAWLGLPDSVHPFNTDTVLVVLAFGLVVHAFTAHATLVRELKQIQADLGNPAATGAGNGEEGVSG